MKRLVYAFALALGVATLGSVNLLKADINRTQPVTIPFQFHVQNKTLPSGEYRIEQEVGTEIATLVNTKTGQRVRVLRPAAMRTQGKAILNFVPVKDGYKLTIF